MKNIISKSIEIDINKKYIFPEKLSYVNYKGKIIVISVNTANWIILDSHEEQDFFELLKVYKIKDAINNYNGDKLNIEKVLIQIEAKKFEKVFLRSEGTKRMMIYLTNSCNMHCPHCYMFAGKANQNELKTDEILNLLKSFKDIGGELVTLSGGEIKMRKDLFQIVKFAHNTGLKVNLLTNGTLWDYQSIREIAPFVFRVQISIDGYSENINSKIRGNQSFEKALFAIDTFIEHDVYTELAMTPFFDSNLIDNYKEYGEFGKRLLKKYSNKKFLMKYTTDLLDGRDIAFNESQKELYAEYVNKIYTICYEQDFIYKPFIDIRKNHEILDNCAFGNLTISSIGDVYLCSRIPSLKPIANIRSESFRHIIKISNKAKELSNIDNLKPCKDCELKYFCGGDCRIKYFNQLTHCNIETLKIDELPARICSKDIKERFYNLMITTNSSLFE